MKITANLIPATPENPAQVEYTYTSGKNSFFLGVIGVDNINGGIAASPGLETDLHLERGYIAKHAGGSLRTACRLIEDYCERNGYDFEGHYTNA